MKKTNDHAEPTNVERLKNKCHLNTKTYLHFNGVDIILHKHVLLQIEPDTDKCDIVQTCTDYQNQRGKPNVK